MRSYLFFFLLITFSVKTISQEWQYYVEDDLKTNALLSWIDDEGNSYHNIARFEPRGQSGAAEVNKYVLILDKNGHFKGIFQISRCNNRALLLPFSDNNYLSSGFNCTGGVKSVKDSRVFNQQGEIVKTGEGINLHHFAQVRTDDGYTVFAANGFKSNQDELQIGSIDWNFKINIQSVNLKPLRRPGLGMLNKFLDPVQAADGGWVIPWHYGEVNGSRLTPKSGMLYKTDGKKILWQYPQTPVNQMVNDLQRTGDKYVALMSNGLTGVQDAHLIDDNGNLIRKLQLRTEGYFEKMMVKNDEIILACRERANPSQALLLYRYNFNGKLLSERRIPANGWVDLRQMLSFDETGILLMGCVTNREQDPDQVAFIWKIDLNEKDETLPPVLVKKQLPPKEEPAPSVKKEMPPKEVPVVSSSSFDFISEEALAVTLYPNPASVYINFTLENPRSPDAKYYIKIFSMDGKPVRQDSFEGEQYEMDIESLTPGTYVYQIFTSSDGKKEFISGKFIKIRS